MTERSTGKHEKKRPDELFLNGRLQIATARDALARTGKNPMGEYQLTTLLDAHKALSDKAAQNDFTVYVQGAPVKRLKADIITSLASVAEDKNVEQEVQIASSALHDILTQE